MRDRTFLVGLKLHGKRCLVVGSSGEALARAEALREAGAHVLLIGDPLPLGIAEAGAGVSGLERPFAESDFEGVFLALLSDRNEDLARRMQLAAEARATLFCAIDQPEFGNFSHSAVTRHGPVSVAVSTDGRAPALARRLKEELARVLGEADIVGFVERLATLRARTPSERRRRVLGDAVSGVRLTGRLELGGG